MGIHMKAPPIYVIERDGRVQEGPDEVRRVFASTEALQNWYKVTNGLPGEEAVPYVSVKLLSELLTTPSPARRIKRLIDILQMGIQRPEPEPSKPPKPELNPELKEVIQKIQGLMQGYKESLDVLKHGLNPETYMARKLDMTKYQQYVKVCLSAINLIAETADLPRILAAIDLEGFQRDLGNLVRAKGAVNVMGSIRYHEKKYALEMWTSVVALLTLDMGTEVVVTETKPPTTAESLAETHVTASDTAWFSVANQFSKFPAGPRKTDGERSGELLREVMAILLRRHSSVVIDLDGTLGYGSSFLRSAFEGLVTDERFSSEELHKRLYVKTDCKAYDYEIWQYIDEAHV